MSDFRKYLSFIYIIAYGLPVNIPPYLRAAVNRFMRNSYDLFTAVSRLKSYLFTTYLRPIYGKNLSIYGLLSIYDSKTVNRWQGVNVKRYRTCGKCGQVGELKRVISQNGGTHIAYCCTCGHVSKWIKKETVAEAGIEILTLPIHAAYNDVRQCEVKGCMNYGYEWHHIAPRHLFGDEAGLWPMVKLCKPHHKQWHDIVTPNMGMVQP